MFTDVLGQVARVLQFSVDFVFNVFDSLGATGFLFGAFSVILIYRLLLVPILGGRLDFTRQEVPPDKPVHSDSGQKDYKGFNWF